MENYNQSRNHLQNITVKDVAQANELFEQFVAAGTLKTILGYYRTLCDLLYLKPNLFPLFYPKLKSNLNSWKAKALWKKFDARASHKCYARGKTCASTRVLIIGAGPCGLRTAIEAQLLGAKVVVIEKRDRLSRNNVLHLWPFVIEDLRALGAKKFFGKFCAGAIDHISIRQLQCILLKVALLLGVEVHTEVSFENLVEPNNTEKIGWRAEFKPSDHPVSQYEFDVIVGADGKRNTLQGFSRKEFRGKLAIAITANFINKHTEAEARVEEISGVAFIFNQKFFKDLNAETGIDLENIVYYKDDTHYFVMTAKKHSLLEKGVIKQDFSDTIRLLSPDNVDKDALLNYSREAADFSTSYQMPDLEFAVNHYGRADVAMFDFTSMYAAENASKVMERNGYKLLMVLVGDSLLEPFWPTGSGCARGFLSSLDACWSIRAWGTGLNTPLEIMAERESIYRLLGQTTPENLNKDCKSYTIDPSTRYPNLNKAMLLPQQLINQYDTDNRNGMELAPRVNKSAFTTESHRKRRRRELDLDPNTLLAWIKDQVKEHEDLIVDDLSNSFKDGRVLCAILHHYRPDLLDYNVLKVEDVVKNNQIAFDLLEKEVGIAPFITGEEMAKTDSSDYDGMFSYLTQIFDTFRGEIPHIKHPKLDMPEHKESKIKCPIGIRHLSEATSAVPNRSKITPEGPISKQSISSERKTKKRKSYDKSVDHENRSNHVRGAGTQEELAARIKNLEDKWQDQIPLEKRPRDLNRAIGKIETSDWNIKEIAKKIKENKLGKPSNKEKERVPKWNKDQFVARQNKMERQHYDRQNSAEVKYSELDKGIKKLEQRLKEGSMRDVGTKKVAAITEKLLPKQKELDETPILKQTFKPPISLLSQTNFEYCHFCQKRVYLMERLCAEGRFFHRGCFKCQYCHGSLRLGSYMFDREGQYGNRFYCSQHYGLPGEISTPKAQIKTTSRGVTREHSTPLEKLKIPTLGIESVDLLDRVQTPERVEFANLSAGNISSDHEESVSQMDEDEWTDRNFGASTAEIHTSDDEEDSSSSSGSESDNEDAFVEAVEEPPTKEGTLKWMERYKQRYSKENKHKDDYYSDDYSSSSDHYYENSSGDDDDDPVTESEEEIRARELRKQEVKLEPIIVHTDTGSDTEIISDESSSGSSSSKQNSATEISTDSEFAVDDPTPTREIPSIILNDFYVTKSRGQYRTPQKAQDLYVTKTRGQIATPKIVQVKSGVLQSPINGKTPKCDVDLKFTPLVSSPVLPKPAPTSLPVRNEGYALNRTQSTGGIATKVSLELKKKYLLGDDGNSRNIQKSGSVATLDSVFKSFHSNISDCQKLLKPASELSPLQQAADKIDNRATSPLSPIISQNTPVKSPEQTDFYKLSSSILSPSNKATLKPITTIDLTSSPENLEDAEFNKDPGKPLSEDNKNKDSDMSSDSLTLDSDLDQHHLSIQKTQVEKTFSVIPRVEIHNDEGDILENTGDDVLLDSLCPVPKLPEQINTSTEIPSKSIVLTEAVPKSVVSEKKSLNQPKTLPGLQKNFHFTNKCGVDGEHVNTRESTPSDHDSCIEHTEMSDWARDSDDFDDVEFELNPDILNMTKSRTTSNIMQSKRNSNIKRSRTENLDAIIHVCGKEKQSKDGLNKFSDIMSSLEFMDTGEETSSDEKILQEAALRNNGYIEFLNEDDIAFDSLNPIINIIEPTSPQIQKVALENLSTNEKNTGYCILEYDNFNEDIEIKTGETKSLHSNEEDNVVNLDGAPGTEDNTCSDSTVRNITKKTDPGIGSIKNQIQYCDVQLKTDPVKQQNPDSSQISTKIELLATPDLIKEDMLNINLSSPPRTPKNIYTKEEIKKAREENQRLVQEMVLNKMKAENKSLERKKHIRSSYSPNRSFDLCKSVTMDMGQICNNNVIQVYAAPDVILTSANCKLNRLTEKAPSKPSDLNSTTPEHRPVSLSKKPSFQIKTDGLNLPSAIANNEASSLPDIQKALNKSNIEFRNKTCKSSLQQSSETIGRRKNSIKNIDNNHFKGKENENINVHIQDSIESLVLNTERRNSLLYCNDTLTKKRVKSGDFSNLELTRKLSVLQPVRTKSVTEISKPYVNNKMENVDISIAEQLYKSDPNLICKDYAKTERKKSKERERKKSITKLFSDFFAKRKETAKSGSPGKGFLSRISPKQKSKEDAVAERTLARSLSGSALPPNWRFENNSSPPPIPPLPLNYLNNETVCCSDDSSEHEQDYKQQNTSSNNLGLERRGSRTVRKAARQAQLKRHRIAQEIQRKLEETEVKTRDLENRGVVVEKQIRGEISNANDIKEESELLKEWFGLMHDLTELRRYERELIVRAQELELEDRHARLQQELRERLDNGEQKTKEDVKAERSIISEMLEIVAKRDCLIGLLEQDRIRYSEEDRDFQEQMVAKGVTPIDKTPNK